MITNIITNNEVDLYYQLNTNKKSNKNNVEIIPDYTMDNIDLDEYEKMFDEIYNGDDYDDYNGYNGYNGYDDNDDNIENKDKNKDKDKDKDKYKDKDKDKDKNKNKNKNKNDLSDKEYINDTTKNFNIEYNEYITNNNINNDKIYSYKNNNKKKIIVCDDCKSDKIIEDTSHGIMVCTNCGQVISNLMDYGAEWSQYFDDNKKDMNRCSHPISQLLPQSSMATTIVGGCSSRIKTLHGWSAMPYKERSLSEVFKIIQKICLKNKILKCIEDDAKIMYKNISECKHHDGKNLGKSVIIRGKNRTSVIAACILFACRKKDKSRSTKEIAKSFELKKTEITKGCKIFQKLAKITNIELKLTSVNPEQFIIRFCEELRVKKKFIDQAVQISNNVQKLQIASVHTPISLATGSIFMMITLNDLDIQKKVIAEKFNVSQVTIAKAYKKLEPFTNLLTNNELCDRLSIEIKKYQDNIELTDQLKIKFIRFNIDVNKIFNSSIDSTSLFNILKIDENNICHINDRLITEHTIEIDNKLKQIENEFLKLNMFFTNDLYEIICNQLKMLNLNLFKK